MIVDKETVGLRIDVFLTQKYPTYSRSYFQYLIDQGSVLINHKKVKKRHLTSLGDEIAISFKETPESIIQPQNIPLEILYEDEELLAINKPPHMVVHPATGHFSNTLVNALLFHCDDLEKTDPSRPGIVHRLDRETSGVILAAKKQRMHQSLVSLFMKRQIKKTYLAVTKNSPGEITVTGKIARHPIKRKEMTISETGKQAVTHFNTLGKAFDGFLVVAELETGRTHQIRVHLKSIKCPVLGDKVYGLQGNFERHLLHAASLDFIHPLTNRPLRLQAPLPADIRKYFSSYCNEKGLFAGKC